MAPTETITTYPFGDLDRPKLGFRVPPNEDAPEVKSVLG